jgi:hypothetical protein
MMKKKIGGMLNFSENEVEETYFNIGQFYEVVATARHWL